MHIEHFQIPDKLSLSGAIQAHDSWGISLLMFQSKRWSLLEWQQEDSVWIWRTFAPRLELQPPAEPLFKLQSQRERSLSRGFCRAAQHVWQVQMLKLQWLRYSSIISHRRPFSQKAFLTQGTCVASKDNDGNIPFSSLWHWHLHRAKHILYI